MTHDSPTPASPLLNDPPPIAPVEPDAGDCCGGGCDPCIFDYYYELKQHYQVELAKWRERHPGEDPAAWQPEATD